MRSMFLALLLSIVASVAQADTYRLVCFTEAGFKAVADRVVNQMQWLNNSMGQTADRNFITRNGCDYSNRRVSEPLLADIYYSEHDFIFPIFRVRLGETRQLMYAADAIFEGDSWYISNSCGRNSVGECVRPHTCEAFRGFLNASRGFLPNYLRAPRDCTP